MSIDLSLSPLVDLPPITFTDYPNEIQFDPELTPLPALLKPATPNIIPLILLNTLGFSSFQHAQKISDRIFTHLESPRATTFKVKGMPKMGQPTFWIELDKTSGQQKVQVNIPGNIVGKGTFKKIKGCLEIALPSYQTTNYVRWLPKTEIKQQKLISCAKIHIEIYHLIHDPLHNARIASPPRFRHDENGIVDLIQPQYPYVLPKLTSTNKLSLQQKITLCYQIFCTIEAFHRHGYVIKDVKPENILVDDDFLPHLNDFDLCTKKFFDMQAEYAFWDLASQKGFITSYCDVVAGAVMILQVIFPQYTKSIEQDTDHSELHTDDSFDDLCKELNVDQSPQAPILRKIVHLVITVIKAEQTVYNSIIESMRKYFKNDQSSLNNWTFQRFYNLRATDSAGVEFTQLLLNEDQKLNEAFLKIAIELLDDKNSAKTKFQTKVKNFYDTLNREEKQALRNIARDHINIASLIFDEKEQPINEIQRDASETLFKNLSTEEINDRLLAFQELEQIAPTITYIKTHLLTISTLCN